MKINFFNALSYVMCIQPKTIDIVVREYVQDAYLFRQELEEVSGVFYQYFFSNKK